MMEVRPVGHLTLDELKAEYAERLIEIASHTRRMQEQSARITELEAQVEALKSPEGTSELHVVEEEREVRGEA